MCVEELLIIESSQSEESIDGIVCIDIEHVLYRPSLGVLSSFRNLITLEPITLSFLSEEKHGVVHGCGIDELREVLLPCPCTFRTDSTSGLSSELTERCSLDVSQMTHGDNHRVVGIEVFRIKFLRGIFDDSPSFVTIFLLHFHQFVFHHFLAKFRVVEN